MIYTNLDHKKIWVEKLENDLEQLKSLGCDKNSDIYKKGVKRTENAKRKLMVKQFGII